ncbi:uncharacterized protein N7515_003829 [Penicillium bovifimosum]|uniref:Uncharacterized protein n=1 Tax=Penicillium bovifimosum TaxID=126998 RepID=A0A9W9H777_9EURO|nr:uncharacterized protein N7515_003829 [Penicillium bovifimosum]KAJ5138981.1 hypothetical protein N7515_003829 [Penicillium bovifimosum]
MPLRAPIAGHGESALVQQALEHLDQRMESIGKASKKTPPTLTNNAYDPAAFWAHLQKWGQGTALRSPSLPKNNGMPATDVAQVDLRDREDHHQGKG